MADIFSKEARSRIMKGIRSKNTQPELLLRRALWAKGLRYWIHYKLPGSPDIAFPSDRVVVFVHGCFWHCCPKHGHAPKTNSRFWKSKLEKNRLRDHRVQSELKSSGWKVVRLWEHQLFGKKKLEKSVLRIISLLGPLSLTAKRLKKGKKPRILYYNVS